MRTGITVTLALPARTTSRLISSELLAFSENTKTMTLAARIACTIASMKFSPGPTSRLAIQQISPRLSSAVQMVRANFRSLEE